MKKNQKRSGKTTISELVFGLIAKGRLDREQGKDSMTRVVAQVRRHFPKSKFKDTHYYWYLSKFRRQKKAGLALDRLHSKKASVKRRKK